MEDFRQPTYWESFLSLALGLAPLFLIFAIAALFGFDTIRINRQPVHGPLAFVYSAATTLFLAAAIAAFQKLGFAMWRLWSPPQSSDRG